MFPKKHNYSLLDLEENMMFYYNKVLIFQQSIKVIYAKMKILFYLITPFIFFSCNNNASEYDLVQKSIEENTNRANEMSHPSFSKDSLKADFKFKRNSLEKAEVDSNLLRVMEKAEN